MKSYEKVFLEEGDKYIPPMESSPIGNPSRLPDLTTLLVFFLNVVQRFLSLDPTEVFSVVQIPQRFFEARYMLH